MVKIAIVFHEQKTCCHQRENLVILIWTSDSELGDSRNMANVLKDEKKQQIIALGRLGWFLALKRRVSVSVFFKLDAQDAPTPEDLDQMSDEEIVDVRDEHAFAQIIQHQNARSPA
jgi:hypothetical protein